MSNELGDLRRNAVVSTFGPGAIVDFRAGGATISAVAAGLEEWDSSFPPAGMMNPQTIQEPRLQKKLGVQGFRLPPVAEEAFFRSADENRKLVAVRFPAWLQCPKCNKIGPAVKWGRDPGKAYRFCPSCAAGATKSFVIPVRFVIACENGHLDEFPWEWWLEHAPDCERPKGDFLNLVSEGAGHSGLILSCPKCRSRRSMDGIFSKSTWDRFKCAGRRLWLGSGTEDCDKHPRALQRGASNLYFPIIESALSIPPWSDKLQEIIGMYWDAIAECVPDQREQFINILAAGVLAGPLAELNLTPAELAAQVAQRLGEYDAISLDLREEEYRQLASGQDTKRSADREFEIRNVAVPQELKLWFHNIVKVVRLREVRALRGFTRITPPGDPDAPGVSKLSRRPLKWLPAIEVRGEGIFMTLQSARLQKWEEAKAQIDRAKVIDDAWKRDWKQRHDTKEVPPNEIMPRYLLLHTFAHALMRQLTLECGYSSASLRERIYCSAGAADMAGILIFTATSDADGTLGGLQRQAEPLRILKTIRAAIQAMEWCSSDPLCIEGLLTKPESFLHAACHACVLAPETSCEEFNRFLDRAALIGSAGDRSAGFFSELLV